jgi:hypothetical protein
MLVRSSKMYDIIMIGRCSVGCWLLVVGCWLLVVGFWLLVVIIPTYMFIVVVGCNNTMILTYIDRWWHFFGGATVFHHQCARVQLACFNSQPRQKVVVDLYECGTSTTTPYHTIPAGVEQQYGLVWYWYLVPVLVVW